MSYPVTASTPHVAYIKDSNGVNHAIAAPYAVLNAGTSTPTFVSFDNLALGVDYVVASSLPTASAAYKGKIYLIPDSQSTETGDYIEYICVNKGTTTENWVWEPIGTTKVNVSVSSATSSVTTTGITAKYDKLTGASYTKVTGVTFSDVSGVTTGTSGAVTINGSNFTFNGTKATLSQSAEADSNGGHSHTIGSSKVYATTVSVLPGDASVTTNAAAFAKAGTAQTVVTGGSTQNVIGSVSTTRLATTSVYPAKDVTAITTVTTSTTSIRPAANVVALTSVTGTTSSIYPAKNVTALTSVTRSTTSIYPAANVSAVTTVTQTTTTLASKVGSTILNTATVDADGVLSFSSTAASGNIVTNVTSSAQSVRGTAQTVVNAVTIAAGTAIRDTAATVVTGLNVPAGKDVRDTAVTVVTDVASDGQAIRDTAVTVATGATNASGGGATVVYGSSNKAVYTSLSTTSITPVGSTANALTSASISGTAINAVGGFTTTSATGLQTLISSVDANTGSTGAHTHSVAVSIEYTPGGTISGTQSVAAHSHTAYVSKTNKAATVTTGAAASTLTHTATNATVTDNGHSHNIYVELSGATVN